MVEYDAIVNHVTMWNVAVERQIRVKGPDAEAFVNRVITRDATRIAPMHAKYVILCNEAGGILNDPVLLRLADEGKTLIVTSHILPELARICNIVAIITQGKLRAFGTLDQIMRQVAQRRSFQVQFLSDGALVQAAELLNEQLGDDADINLSQAEAVIRFSTTKKDAAIARVLRTLAEKDLGVAEFAEVQADLEDAFLSVTKDQPAAASSGDVHVNAGSRG